MNPETIDSEYAKLEQQTDQVGQAIVALSQKLQASSQADSSTIRDWQLDLKTIALQVQQEQLQMQSLLQAVHDFTVSHLSDQGPAQQPYGQQSAYAQQPYGQQPAYAPQPAYGFQQPGGGGMLSRFLGGGFGRAIVTGAGFGIGDDIINRIL